MKRDNGWQIGVMVVACLLTLCSILAFFVDVEALLTYLPHYIAAAWGIVVEAWR